MNLDIKTPRWSIPLLSPCRYKGAYGGRGSGKSHFFAEMLVEEHVANPDQKSVGIREIQKSLKYSAKALIETKIHTMGVAGLFEITQTEIRRKGATGVIIFQGMQDHTADSIKSLEGFDRAWVEEAQNLSERSLRLLRPTIRKESSEIWFSWNPDQPTDAVDNFLRGENPPNNMILVHVNYDQNPFLSDTLRQEMQSDVNGDPEVFNHVWKGGYNTRSKAQVFADKYKIEEFEPKHNWDGPYYGMDFGFAQDPTVAVKVWIYSDCLWIENDAGQTNLELDDTAGYFKERIPGIDKHAVRADSARPESISYLKRKGIPMIEPVKKGAGSVEDGITYMLKFNKIVIHPQCEWSPMEFRLYSYKIDRYSGDILPQIIDANNHAMDAIRYALQPMIGNSQIDYSKII